jgi:hypothetical protein
MYTNLELLRRDLIAAKACFDALGDLTASVRGSLAGWFHDIDAELVFPLSEMPLESAERSALTGTVIVEMLDAVTRVAGLGLSEAESFERLAPVLDPLWKEFLGLSAGILNEVWRSSLPSDDEERQQRIHALEMMTGLSREDIASTMTSNRRLRGLVSRFGITAEDLA